MSAGRPPLELAVEIKDANGATYRWDSNTRAEDRPQGLTFSTKRGDGFAQGGCTLSRRVDSDHLDLGLKNDVSFIGADGSVAYEGRIAATPRSFGQDGHSISVQTAGWMSYAKQRKFSMPIIDRDLSRWMQASRAWRAANMVAGYAQADGSVNQDSAIPALELAFTVAAASAKWATTMEYDAGSGNKIAGFYVDWQNGTNAPPVARVYSDDTDDTVGTTTELTAAGAAYYALSTPHRYLFAEARNDASALTAGLTYSATLRDLAVIGNHGLTRQGAGPGGFYASDVIRWIAQTYCPKLDTSGVQDTTYAIPHLVFDRVFPFDAFLEVNKYHLWDLGVWEKRTLTYGPTNLTDYDWQIRLDHPGVTVDFQGDSTEDLFNGIVVTYQSVDTGKTEVLTPDDDATLADTSITNPANIWGEDQWDEAPISIPTDAAGAAQIGRMILAEKNAPKSPGTYRVTGHIQDRAGHWQPVWKVRAGDTIAITSSNSLSDRPHLIVETNYTQDDVTVQIGVDNTLPRVDAVLDRFGVALQAAGLA